MQMSFKNIIISMLLLSSTGVVWAQQENSQSKELVISKPLAAGSRIIIDQLDRKITIKASPDNTIKLVTTVFYTGQNSVTDAEWWDYLNIQVKELTGLVSIQPVREYDGKVQPIKVTRLLPQKGKDSVRIQYETQAFVKKTYSTSTYYDFDEKLGIGNGVAQFDSAGKWVNRKSNIRRELVIYLPAASNLKIESRFGDIIVETNLSELNAVIDHSSLTMQDATTLILRSSYGHITTGNIKVATIDITGGKWSGKKVDKLNITSNSSSVDLGSALDLTINSGDDQYDVDEIKTVHGTKDFGNLRVLQLTGSMDITGNSAHIKIRNITDAVTLVKINDQFADLKLPLSNLKNYTVSFQGTTSKVYAPFTIRGNNTEFNTSAGDTKGTHTAIQLRCSNCTVEFQ